MAEQSCWRPNDLHNTCAAGIQRQIGSLQTISHHATCHRRRRSRAERTHRAVGRPDWFADLRPPYLGRAIQPPHASTFARLGSVSNHSRDTDIQASDGSAAYNRGAASKRALWQRLRTRRWTPTTNRATTDMRRILREPDAIGKNSTPKIAADANVNARVAREPAQQCSVPLSLPRRSKLYAIPIVASSPLHSRYLDTMTRLRLHHIITRLW